MTAAPDDEFRFSPRPNRAHEIEWRPWGPQAFAEAHSARKPVLLSISAVWCHWCHVMDETTYSDPEVIAAINDRFVPVRIDNDRRPDINRRYNMGGWPTTAFLTPSGELIAGVTYLPPEQLRRVLAEVSGFYAQHRDGGERVRPRKVAVGRGAGGGADAPPAAPRLTARLVDDVVTEAAALYDPLHGGLGDEPKFPQPDAVRLLLYRGARDGDERLERMALSTLTAMAAGEIHDRVGGGFFRYATRRDWSEPHYEKMLDGNARLALLYLDAQALTGDEAHAGVADDIVGFLMGTMRRADAPLFCGSIDADESYYRLDAAGREGRAAPALDTTAYVDGNALAARALLRASYLRERPDLAAAAALTLDELWERGQTNAGLRHYLGGDVTGLLADQAASLAAFVEAHEVTGERRWLERARLVADFALQQLQDDDGRFVDRPRDADDGGGQAGPLPVIEAGAEMADALLHFAALTGRPSDEAAAIHALAAHGRDRRQYGVFATPLALAVMRFLTGAPHVIVVGDPADPRSLGLLRAALTLADPFRTVLLLDPDADAETVAREGYDGHLQPVAYACAGTVCSKPTSNPDAVAGWVAAAASPPAPGAD